MKIKGRFLFGGAVIIITLLTLFILEAPGASGQEITLKELIRTTSKFEGKYVLTEGKLIEDSIQWNAEKIELKFQIKDDEGNTLLVIYDGVRPDNFSEGIIVLLEGYIKPNLEFQADKVQTQCPSKYESEDSDEYDMGKHQIKQPDTAK